MKPPFDGRGDVLIDTRDGLVSVTASPYEGYGEKPQTVDITPAAARALVAELLAAADEAERSTSP
jgi:hypothetical protein